MAQRGVDIDGKKLRKIFEQRGLVVADVGKELGYSQGSFSGALHKNRLLVQSVVFLESKYSIKYDDYKLVEPVEVVEKPESSVVKIPTSKEIFEEVKDDLYKLIYAAVYEAVKKAWSE